MNIKGSIFFSFFIVCFLSFSVYGQDFENINLHHEFGTSRTFGLAGAQSVMGADVGGIYSNPASLGLFRKSELSITPSLGSNVTNVSYLNKTTKTNNSLPLLSNLGVAFSTTDDTKKKGIKNYTLSIVYNRIGDFNSFIDKESFNPAHSFTSYLGDFVSNETTKNPNALDINGAIIDIENLSQLAWKSGLIDIDNNGNFYGIANKGGINQEVRFLSEGYHTSWNFGAGINYEDFVYFGLGVDINQYEYSSQLRIIETDTQDSIANFNRFEYQQNYLSSGNGMGLNFGAILKPLQYWRFGISVKTAVKYQLNSIQNNVLNDVDLSDNADISLLKSYIYNMPQTETIVFSAPKITIGNYIQFKKHGFITTDFEYNFLSSINKNYQNVYRFSNGIEFRKDEYRIRGGWGWQNSIFINRISPFFALGGGYRKGDFFVDVAYNINTSQRNISVYRLNNFNNTLDIKNRKSIFSFTLGLKF